VAGARFPQISRPLGLGVGLDLPWGHPIGFTTDERGRDGVGACVVKFLTMQRDTFSHLFVSWQPKNRNRVMFADYVQAYDDLFERAPRYDARALHQTAFDLGALEPYDRTAIIELTNALVERYDLGWVNEDLGLWSIHGRPLPYPLPPYLTDAGLAAAIRNTAEVQRALRVPLLVEFPGFSDGTNLVIGSWHAYDFFRRVVEETASPCTLDIGHLLSYQWLRGKRGGELYAELERLPLDHCFEIHLSGCEVAGGRFFDYHHGVLMSEQLELLSLLVPRCPNVRAITYEDPKFDRAGVLAPQARPSLERLHAWVGART
jgi:uncharacterized protein (UPF0276 family)